MADEYGCVRGAAMRCLASMDTVGQCYASAIAGELTSQDQGHASGGFRVVVGWFLGGVQVVFV